MFGVDHIKLGTRYYPDPAILAANRRTGGQAELLYLRALAQCGADEAEGHVPEDAIQFLGLKNAAKVAAILVEENLWEKNGDGWKIRSWEKWQSEHDILARRRKAERERKRAQRAREADEDKGPPDPDPSRDESRDRPTPPSRDVTPPNARDYRDLSSSSGYVSSSVTRVDPRESLLPLRQALEDVKLLVRWDKLDPGTVDRIAWLMDTHGVRALVAAAQRAWQPNDPPAFANAWLGAWDSLPLPNAARISVVPPWCGECESDEHRWIERPDGRAAHCPRCHPSTVRQVTA